MLFVQVCFICSILSLTWCMSALLTKTGEKNTRGKGSQGWPGRNAFIITGLYGTKNEFHDVIAQIGTHCIGAKLIYHKSMTYL